MNPSGTRRQFLGLGAVMAGTACLGRRLAHAGAKPDEIAALKAELAVQFQTRQVRDRMLLFRRLVAKYGSGVVAEVEANTIEQVRSRVAAAEVDPRDLSAVKKLLWDQLDTGFEFECVEDTPTRLAYKVKRCFLAEAVAEFSEPQLGHAFYCAWDVGFCQGLNPEIRFTRTQTLMAGDSSCNHTYELPG